MNKKTQKKAHKQHPSLRTRPSKISFHSFRGGSDIITKIRVVGVGGAGGNAVTRMMEAERPRGIEFVAVNTDVQDLDYAIAHKKIYIGKALTRGLGAGMNPEVGRQAAEENRSEIGELLEGSDVVFITAGLGGGTGTGAAPVVAEIAREKGILTIAFVTKPFTFEGAQRMQVAQEGLGRLKDKVDALVVIPNDRIFNIIDKDTSIVKAFAHIDEVLKQGVHAIAELVNTPGIVNVDFADIKTIMKDAGTTLIGVGLASGQERSVKAVTAAINSPLLEFSIEGARGVLFSVAGGRDLKMSEINDVARMIAQGLDPQAKVIFGAYHDRRLKDKVVKVTVIATGFAGVFERHHNIAMPTLFMADDPGKHLSFKNSDDSKSESDNDRFMFKDLTKETKERDFLKTDKDTSGREKDKEKIKLGEDDAGDDLGGGSWEIPAFLRKRKK